MDDFESLNAKMVDTGRKGSASKEFVEVVERKFGAFGEVVIQGQNVRATKKFIVLMVGASTYTQSSIEAYIDEME